MENIYQYALARVREGAQFRVNLERRTLTIDNSEYEVCGSHLGVPLTDSEHVLATAETLYFIYKNSIPSARNERRRKRYFKALPLRELSDDAMLYGENREYAQVALELFLLCSVANGSLSWDDSWGSYFWQSERDRDFVILRSWIEPKG